MTSEQMTGEATVEIGVPPDAVYALVSDVTRYGEWSPENLGGTWLDGATGPAVGARFKAKNKRKVSWTTTCKVLTADPGREFSFSVGKGGETVWGYRIEAVADGTRCRVTEWFTSAADPGFVEKILIRFATGVSVDGRAADLVRGMETTLSRLKTGAEGLAWPN